VAQPWTVGGVAWFRGKRFAGTVSAAGFPITAVVHARQNGEPPEKQTGPRRTPGSGDFADQRGNSLSLVPICPLFPLFSLKIPEVDMPRRIRLKTLPSPDPVGFSLSDISDHKFADLRAAKQEWSKRLIARPSVPASRALIAAVSPEPDWNLMGVGIGEKLVDGRRTGSIAVKLFVRVKYPQAQLRRKHTLPKTIDGVPVDVEEVGLFRRLAAGPIDPRARLRPAPPGCSAGFDDPQGPMAGTIGAIVQDANGIYVLSNNHVLAEEGALPLGAPIYQPGLRDGGNAVSDQIAQLSNFVGLLPGVLNQVDCAVAAVQNPADVSNAILQIGPPRGAGTAQFDMVVQKFGRSTGYTVGQVTSVDTDMTVQFENGSYTFGGQILISGLEGQTFADSGDSGSLVVQRGTNLAVGLLFAGSPSGALANHLTDVLQQLNITLVI
jgi:hypothetical protein